MKFARVCCIAVILSSIALLTACSDSIVDPIDEEQVLGTPGEETPITEHPIEPVIPELFLQLPTELTLSPDEQLDIAMDGATYYASNPQLLQEQEHGVYQIAAEALTGEKAVLTIAVADQRKEITIKIKYSLSETVTMVDGVATVTNPSDLLVLVNKERNLPADYVPEDLMPPDVPFYFSENIEKRWLRPDAAQALEGMFAAASLDDIKLVGASAYRSYNTQVSLFKRYVNQHGEEAASRFSARPGQSEHQTGLTVDVYHAQITNGLEEAFAETPEGIWVAENAHKYGFIIRYPQGKEEITGYKFEPWHLRYVGTTVAQEIFETELTLEEYLHEDETYYTKK